MKTNILMNQIGAATLAAVLLASVPADAVPGDRVEKEEKTTVQGAGKTGITIKNARGRTVLVGRQDATTVSVVAMKTAVGKDAAEAKAMLDKVSMDVSERGDQVVIETRDGNKYEDWGWSVLSVVKGTRRSAWIDYTIEVPYGFAVSASTASGEIRISNVGGRAEVAATSGDVSIRGVAGGARASLTSGEFEASDIGGDLAVSATSGNVVIDNVRGALEIEGTSGDFQVSRIGKDLKAQLTSGDFVLEGCSGNVVFRAASGDARLTEIGGSVDASSSSGDIELLVTPVAERKFMVSTSSGDVNLFYVPVKNYGFLLDVSTASGSIEGEMPIKVNRVDRRRLQGVVGSGLARIEIDTASGDVSIMENNDAATKPAR
jgi:DUF4097 and DUF4098 domain-containing protein YvlB